MFGISRCCKVYLRVISIILTFIVSNNILSQELKNSLKDDSILYKIKNHEFLGKYFDSSFYHKKYDKNLMNLMGSKNPFEYSTAEPVPNTTGYGNLNRSGSFTRGINFGNNQDLVLSSYADIQLSGKISDSVELFATLTDRNIPIQAEGTTANLQNIDQKYIGIRSPKLNIQLGDLLLGNSLNNYFLKFNKKVQGINVAYKDITEKDSYQVHGTLSLSRGKWNRLTINGVEGNQGPYRLKGVQNELFITILSGTEKIYLNGKVLKRGQNNDYTIDYNTGELYFTPKNLINKYDRIIAEYQYADRNYQRILAEAGFDIQNKGWKYGVNVFQENDNKSVPLFADLQDSDKIVLIKAGDKTEGLGRSSVQNVDYNPDKILYKRLNDSPGFVYYKFSNNSDSAKYSLTFSNVGFGNGNYIQSKSLANGKVYQYLPPINGTKQGNYEPLRILAAPERRRMITFSALNSPNKEKLISIESAISEYKKNTFSSLDTKNDIGLSTKIKTNHVFKSKTDSNSVIFKIGTDYEFKSNDFQSIERYRDVEFFRSWDRQISNSNSNVVPVFEHIGKANLGVSKKTWNVLNTTSLYNRGGSFSGYQDLLVISKSIKQHQLSGSGELTLTDNKAMPLINREFQRLNFSYNLNKEFVSPGVEYNFEASGFRKGLNLFYDPLAYNYNEITTFIKSGFKNTNKFYVGVTLREDKKGSLDSMKQFFSKGLIYSLRYELNNYKNAQIKFDTKFRDYFEIQKDNNEKNITSRIELDFNSLKKSITGNSYYELNSGKEPKRDFVFIQTAKGQGYYTWIDYNKNGLKEFNEFEKAIYQDQAEYIKVIVPSNILVDAFSVKLQQTLKFQPEMLSEGEKTKKILSKFYNLLTVRGENKTYNNFSKINFLGFNPFKKYNSLDTSLLSSSYILKNSIFFNRESNIYALDFNYVQSKTRTLLVSGYDNAIKDEYLLNNRINLNSFLTLEPSGGYIVKSYFSDYVNNKNYYIVEKRGSLNLNIIASNSLNFFLKYTYTFQKDSFNDKLSAKTQDFGLEGRFSSVKKGYITAKINYVNINYSQSLNSEGYNSGVSWELLQGLRPGKNITWEASWNQRLQNNLQLSFSYNGRKSGIDKTIHISKASVTWFF